MRYYSKIFILVACIFNLQLSAQGGLDPDSLKKILSETQNDSLKLLVYENLTEFCELNEVEQFAAPAIVLANKMLHDTKTNVNFILEKKEAILNNRGFAAQQMSDVSNALNYYYEALKIAEKLKSPEKQGIVLLNISSLFRLQEDFNKALEICTRGYELVKKTKYLKIKSALLNDIGVCYSSLENNQKAYEKFVEALNIDAAINDSLEMATAYLNIGRELKTMGKTKEAIAYMKLSLEISERIHDDFGIAQALLSYATLLNTLDKVDEAIKVIERALKIYKQLGNEIEEIQCYSALTGLHYQKGHYKESVEALKLYMTGKEKIMNEANQRTAFKKDLQFEYSKKEAKILADKEKQELLAKEEKQKHQIIIASVSIGLAMAFVFGFFVFRAYRQKQKDNVIITKQKLEVEHQRELVVEKNKEIMDSIHYAQRIQRALITNEKYIERNLNKLQEKG